jgi:hypothetical protein
VEARARAAEEAARVAEKAAVKKMALLNETAAGVVARVDEEALARAVDAQLAAINADADYRVSVAARNSHALKRALSASAFSVELWRERAEVAAADLAWLTTAAEAEQRGGGGVAAGDAGRVGGRIAAAAFSTGADLRAFVSSGPRISVATSSGQVRELNAVGLGAPVSGRYDQADSTSTVPSAPAPAQEWGDDTGDDGGGGGEWSAQQKKLHQAEVGPLYKLNAVYPQRLKAPGFSTLEPMK